MSTYKISIRDFDRFIVGSKEILAESLEAAMKRTIMSGYDLSFCSIEKEGIMEFEGEFFNSVEFV